MAKVLLLDNQTHMLELLRSKFEVEGFEVLACESGEEGVAVAERELPDLIVLDERLQDADGTFVSERLQASELAGEIPVILLTSRASEGGAGKKDGNSQAVQMPFRPSQLMALVRENL
ncbi:MAG TPA: response regulator [Trueperaceae bacterium]